MICDVRNSFRRWMWLTFFLFYGYDDHRDLHGSIHSFPTRRSSDLKPVNREDSWRRLMSGVGAWALIGMGPWAVELKADGRMVGHCGFFHFERDMRPSIVGE